MKRTQAAVVDVRIRFAGLCMFVPDPSGAPVHVLLPETGPEHPHVRRLYWRDGPLDPEGQKRDLLPQESLTLGGWSSAQPSDPSELFDLKNYPAKCTKEDRGKVDLKAVAPAAWIRLLAGGGTVINAGARWLLPGDEPEQAWAMPTVMDWWMRDAPVDQVDSELTDWSVADVDALQLSYPWNSNPVVDLWLLHVPEGEDPSVMGSTPRKPTGSNLNLHFGAHLSLLTCDRVLGPPIYLALEAKKDDPWIPYWPGGHSIIGALVDCGKTRAAAAV
jgi:hypothetical protein